ncbi:MAG: hypothetical protein E7C50_00395 [Clostridium sp.]|uniref:hypothetical protein n=1 Tax=Clostridium sp. TaxID=1506 RepID=UPI0029020CA8|nr:hypothetical protein [Clostridium sp.]MDU2674223.1 hypothetical protein [Clostridium sp.]MDU2680318.1 hypothetical protein [Clostridium sp.]
MKGKISTVIIGVLLLGLIAIMFFFTSKIFKLENRIELIEENQKVISEEIKNYQGYLEENKRVIIEKEDKVSVSVNENFEKDGLKLNVRSIEINPEMNKGFRVVVTLDIENLEDEKKINVGNLIKITDKNDNRVEDTISFDSNLKTLTKNEDIQVKREYISETSEINMKVAGVIINQ